MTYTVLTAPRRKCENCAHYDPTLSEDEQRCPEPGGPGFVCASFADAWRDSTYDLQKVEC